MSTSCEACHLLAGGVGKLWRRHRRNLPPEVRDHVAELLLLLRLHLLPPQNLDIDKVVGRSRYDVRGISQLFAYLASSDLHNTEPLPAPPSQAMPVYGPTATGCEADTIKDRGITSAESELETDTESYGAPSTTLRFTQDSPAKQRWRNV